MNITKKVSLGSAQIKAKSVWKDLDEQSIALTNTETGRVIFILFKSFVLASICMSIYAATIRPHIFNSPPETKTVELRQ